MSWPGRWMSVAAIGGVVAALQGASAGAQAPGATAWWDEAKLSKPSYRVRMEHNLRIPMRDGVMLSNDIYRPDAPGTFPVLLWRTPYSNNTATAVEESKWYAERGYVVVAQDVRGRYDSDGVFDAFRHEADDGYDTAEWIATQPWNNGKVGTTGGSYSGYTQQTHAVRGSRNILALTPQVSTLDVYNNWIYIDGALHYGFSFPWGAVNMDGRSNQFSQAYAWPAIFPQLPLARVDEAASHRTAQYRNWVSHPARRGKRLVIGPWAHAPVGVRNNAPASAANGPDPSIDFGPAAVLDVRTLYLRWFDYWLKGIDNGVATEAPIKLFVMGDNVWRDEHEWPLARTQYTKYFISSGGRANSLRGDGVLSTVAPGSGQDASPTIRRTRCRHSAATCAAAPCPAAPGTSVAPKSGMTCSSTPRRP